MCNVSGVVLGYWNEPVSVLMAVKRQSAMGRVIFHPAQLHRSKTSSPVLGSRGDTQLTSAYRVFEA